MNAHAGQVPIFEAWQAAVHCGATLQELLDWETTQRFPGWFKAKVVAFYRSDVAVSAHAQDAAIEKGRRKRN